MVNLEHVPFVTWILFVNSLSASDQAISPCFGGEDPTGVNQYRPAPAAAAAATAAPLFRDQL